MAKLWGGRFEGETDDLVEQLGESVSFDARLAPWDIQGSIAHARMLGDTGIISKKDARDIVKGLEAILEDIEAGQFEFDPSLEDVHTNIEAALVDRIGDAGKRLHTGRSRNDQIATDVRLWMRDQIDVIVHQFDDVRAGLVLLAEKNEDVIFPGYTHLQHAQPVLFAHHLLAYFEMFSRDQERFKQLRKRVNVMPLGSAAMAGTPYPIDRRTVAEELDFEGITHNSMDAVADRDHFIEFCSNSAIVMMHLSRLCEELILWSSSEFGFIEIGDAFTTGSSIMPQKKNPDVAELVRGKTGRAYGALMNLLTVTKGLPLTYNRDLQEDKPPLFDASDTVQLSLAVFARMLPAIEVRAERMLAATAEGFMEATDLADYLAEKGVPFREAHAIVGRIVVRCIQEGETLPSLPLEVLREYSARFEADVAKVMTPQAIVARRNNIGGTGPKRVRSELRKARRALG